jgi:hypothetical protein
MNKSITPVIISVLVGIVLGAGAMYIGQSQKNQEAVVAKSYKTFASETSGVSFTHSSDYDVKETNPSANRQTITLTAKNASTPTAANPSEAPTSITIDIYKNGLGSKTLADWVKAAPESNFKQSSDGYVASTTIANRPALTYSWDGLYAANSVVLARNKDVIMVTMTYISATDPIWKDYATVLQTLQIK